MTFGKRNRTLKMAAACVLCLTNLSAATIILDGDTDATGLNLPSAPLVTPAGTVTLVQNDNFQFISSPFDLAFIMAGSTGNQFDIVNSNLTPPLFSFDFDVASISFIYGGGNAQGIRVDALDANNNVVDSFVQLDTGPGQPAGPATLTGAAIRGLQWNDTAGNQSFAALDNISVVPVSDVPEQGTLVLVVAGLLCVPLGRRRRMRG